MVIGGKDGKRWRVVEGGKEYWRGQRKQGSGEVKNGGEC